MSPLILSASLQGRAGIWLHGRANGGSCTSQPSARVSTRWVRAAQRHWADGSRGLETRAHITNMSWCAAGQSPPELLWLIPWEGSQLQPRRDWSTSHTRPEFSSFSIDILPKLFSRKVVPQPTVLPGWSSVKWKKKTIETSSTSLVFCLGFWECKKWIPWLCRWVSTGWMWFLNVISVVKLDTEPWCLMCQSIKACCYARNDVVALCGLLGIAKMGQKYQEKV